MQKKNAPHSTAKDRDRAHAWTFFRQWLKNPLSMAAVSPSSRELAGKMLKELPHGARRIIELGGGTGVFTRALLDRGIAPNDLLVLELNEALYQHLKQRFPDVHVVCGDARELKDAADQVGFLEQGPADAVVSGLGLLSMSRGMQRGILDSAFSVLGPEGRFIQFTYGPTNPVARDVMHELHLIAERTSFAFFNVPPAAVYVFRRSRSTRVHATPVPSPR